MIVISTLTIGDFSRATHLSAKTLRHYHEVGLLEPVDVDADTGYRRYAIEQIATTQIIRRFRDLDMPLDDIHAVLDATDGRPQGVSACVGRIVVRLGDTLRVAPSQFDHRVNRSPATLALRTERARTTTHKMSVVSPGMRPASSRPA